MASGDYLAIFTPFHITPHGVSATATLTFRGSHPVISFDDSSDEFAIFSSVLPSAYSGGGLTILIHWIAASATSNNCIWEAAIERIGTTQDIDSDSFASTQTVTTAAPGTSGVPVVSSIAFTSGAQMDSLVAGEAYRISINRNANNASDNMTGDAQIIRVVVRET